MPNSREFPRSPSPGGLRNGAGKWRSGRPPKARARHHPEAAQVRPTPALPTGHSRRSPHRRYSSSRPAFHDNHAETVADGHWRRRGGLSSAATPKIRPAEPPPSPQRRVSARIRRRPPASRPPPGADPPSAATRRNRPDSPPAASPPARHGVNRERIERPRGSSPINVPPGPSVTSKFAASTTAGPGSVGLAGR